MRGVWKVLCTMACLAGPAVVYGQGTHAHAAALDRDSLATAFSQADTDPERLRLAMSLVMAWSMPPDERIGPWCDTLMKYAVALHDTAHMHMAQGGRLSVALVKGDQQRIIALASEGLRLAEAAHDDRKLLAYRLQIAEAQREQGDLSSALDMLLNTIARLEKVQQRPHRAGPVYKELGEVYLYLGETGKAIASFQRGSEVVKGTDLRYLEIEFWLGTSAAYRAQHEPGKAMERVDSAATLLTDDRHQLVLFSLEKGLVCRDLGRVADARDQFRTAVALSDSTDRAKERVRARIALAALVPDAEAGRLLKEAVDIARRNALHDDLAKSLRALFPVLARTGRSMEAVQAAEEAFVLTDSLFDERKNRAVQQMRVKYETDLKDREILGLQQLKELQEARAGQQQLRIDRQRQFIIGAALIGVLLLLASVFAYRAFRIKRRAAAELELKNAEVLKQKERAEESEKAKDRFLANVSHEVRTPLNAIMGFTGLLMHEAKDERSARFLGNIRDAGDNLLVVINDVLDLSRIEAGRLQLVREPFELHRCIHLCAEILQHRANEQRNALGVELGDAPQWVLGDSARLTQIVLNLTGNALKFTTNGTVTISVERQDDGVVLRVRDTGIGIPQEKLGSVFERFTQVHDSDQRVHGGTGLGLSIVKELVQLHKGTIQVESEVGRGTLFTVRLPLQEVGPPEGAPALHTVVPASLEGRIILIAEDNDMNALVTEETLARSFPRARLERVKDGEEVLRRMEHGSDVALVLMDVQMPVLDGISATRAIRRMPGAMRNVPIIALTASVLPNDLSRCIDAGMDACVPKPFKALELLAAIARLTGDRAASTPAAAPQGEGDMLAALFKRMVPDRLKALQEARAKGDREKMLRVVHSLRPQLVHHDAPTFSDLCTRILAFDPKQPPAEWDSSFDAFLLALEQALARMR